MQRDTKMVFAPASALVAPQCPSSITKPSHRRPKTHHLRHHHLYHRLRFHHQHQHQHQSHRPNLTGDLYAWPALIGKRNIRLEAPKRPARGAHLFAATGAHLKLLAVIIILASLTDSPIETANPISPWPRQGQASSGKWAAVSDQISTSSLAPIMRNPESSESAASTTNWPLIGANKQQQSWPISEIKTRAAFTSGHVGNESVLLQLDNTEAALAAAARESDEPIDDGDDNVISDDGDLIRRTSAGASTGSAETVAAFVGKQLAQEKRHQLKANKVKRLLVRQLTSLIMNNEPEAIADSMRGTQVSGQISSESERAADDNDDDGGDDGQPMERSSVSGANGNGLSLQSSSSFGNLAPSMLVANERTNQAINLEPGSDLLESAHTMQDNSQPPPPPSESLLQKPQAVEANPISAADSDPLTDQDPEAITCPPDQEIQVQALDGPISSNMSLEQQQQLLDNANSWGLIVGPHNGNNFSSIRRCVAKDGSSMADGGIGDSQSIMFITTIVAPVVFGFIVVIGLIGNVIVIWITIAEKKKTEHELAPNNLLILDLSVGDLSFIFFCIPFTGWDYAVGHWVFGAFWCKCNQYLIIASALSSIYTLVLMSIDRFLAIVYPIECMSHRTSKNTLYAIYIKWAIILVAAIPTLFMHGLTEMQPLPMLNNQNNSNGNNKMSIQQDIYNVQYKCRFLTDQYDALRFQIIFFVTSYLFPLVLILVLYCSLLRRLWRRSRPQGHKESVKALESKKKVTWLVAAIVIVFAICWGPIQAMLINMRLKVDHMSSFYVGFQVFSHCLGYMNSCINPLIYAFASETFMNSFKRTLIGRLCFACCCPARLDHHCDTHYGNNSNYHHHNSNNNNNTNSSSNQTRDRSSNFRTIHGNNTSLNYLDADAQKQCQANLEQVYLEEAPMSYVTPYSGGATASNESNVSTTTLLMTPHTSNTNGNCNELATNVKPSALPLEPRDRDLASALSLQLGTPSKLTADAPNQTTVSSNNGQQQGQPATSLFTAKQQPQPTKQQLVAHVVQSGNQVSHRCEPCYQQQEELEAP